MKAGAVEQWIVGGRGCCGSDRLRKICRRCFERWISDIEFVFEEFPHLRFEADPAVVDMVKALIHGGKGQGLFNPKSIIVANPQCGVVCVNSLLRQSHTPVGVAEIDKRPVRTGIYFCALSKQVMASLILP